MDERTALAATGLEAFETAEPRSPNWTDADRAWADRVALDAAPAGAPLEAFAGARARHALQRLGPREPALARLQGPSLREARWTVGAVVLAFVVGLLADGLAGSRHINLLAPPMWGVLAWNAFVYLGLLVWPLVQLSPPRQRPARADRARRGRADRPAHPPAAAHRRQQRRGAASLRGAVAGAQPQPGDAARRDAAARSPRRRSRSA